MRPSSCETVLDQEQAIIQDLPAGNGSHNLLSKGGLSWPVLIISGYFLINFLIVSPAGNFPLNDDWIYGHSVKLLGETGQLSLGASCAACFLHIALGAAACKLFGFSYTVLHMVTLLLGLGGALALYAALRELGLKRRVSTLFVMVYAGNPLVVNLCFSFMTDIAALTFTNIYFYFTARAIKRDCRYSYMLAGLALISSLAVRQTAAVFVACNFLVLIMLWLRRKHSWPAAFFLIALPVLSLLALQHWQSLLSRFPTGYTWYQSSTGSIINGWLKRPVQAIFMTGTAIGQISCYTGLFCAPVLLAFSTRLRELLQHKVRIAPAWYLLAGLVAGATLEKSIIYDHRLMPFNQNLLRIPPVGASSIMGINIALLRPGARMWLTISSAALALILMSVLGAGIQCAAALAEKAFARYRKPDGQAPSHLWRRGGLSIFCFSAMALTLGLLVVETFINDLDRYYLMVLPPVLLCLALCWRWLRIKTNTALPFALSIIIAIYSTMSAQDYMGWNRARWHLLTALEKKGIPSHEIDGGAEYNFDRDELLANDMVTSAGCHGFVHLGAPPRDKWRWWPVHGEKYIVSFSPVPDYTILAQSDYWSGLSFSHRTVLMLKHL